MSELTVSNEQNVAYEDIAECRRDGRPLNQEKLFKVQVVDENLQGGLVEITDPVPTGRQLLEAAGKTPVDNFVLLLCSDKGLIEEVNLSETVDVYHRGVEQFIAFENDRLFYVALDGQRFPWGNSLIQESVLRRVAGISDERVIMLEHRSEPDQMLLPGVSVDLAEPGLEKLYTKPQNWKLNVQGVLITFNQPLVLASEALLSAGFNPDQGWILILKVKGEPKKSIGMNDQIDLRKPGIEKLRLTPAEINNGEGAIPSPLAFALLEKDSVYLNAIGAKWETTIDAGRRWLIIQDYNLPSGYNHVSVNVAIEIPTTYPDAALDMFYVYPALTLANGGGIAQTQSTVCIYGTVYQRWSRHLNGVTKWNPLTHSVLTHMAVIEESLLREVGE